jgi:hypothetical protein
LSPRDDGSPSDLQRLERFTREQRTRRSGVDPKNPELGEIVAIRSPVALEVALVDG